MPSRIPKILVASLWTGMALLVPAGLTAAATNSFNFRLPLAAAYRIETPDPAPAALVAARPQWLRAQAADSSQNTLFGSRVVLQLKSPGDLPRLIAGHDLQLARTVTENIFILQAPDAWTAAGEAQRLAALPEVLTSYPVMRSEVALQSPYASKPNDGWYPYQWFFENRDIEGRYLGVDINLRGAWAYTKGAGVTVAVADNGIELTHPELTNALAGAPHHNFETGTADGSNPNSDTRHGTAVAGLIGAQADNSRGVVGVAPGSRLASWVVIGTNATLATNGFIVSDESLMDAFQYQSNIVAVQNHSWGNPGVQLFGPSLLAKIGISNAIAFGRNGRGVVMARAAGNGRPDAQNANDDAYASDPRVICVGAMAYNGRAASYSSPGACLLVSAGSGDNTDPTVYKYVFTTDLQGSNGYNGATAGIDGYGVLDWSYNDLAPLFNGTSATSPQIAGIAALMLSVNTNLTYRDVQQILILASRHFDLADPDLITNGAGMRVSHNNGFGVPDAGVAVQLARQWINRPAATNLTFTWSGSMAIPDDGLRLLVTGSGVPAGLASVHTLPSLGPHADAPTATLPLVDFGFGTNVAGYNLTNKGALIQRDAATFATKIGNAAQAGAAFAVVYNYLTNTTGAGAPGGDQLLLMGGTDFVPIPAVFISHTDGEALKALFATNGAALARISLNSTSQVFAVTNTLLCEHVGVRLKSNHPLRGDVRITLVSPTGTRSVLQTFNTDTNAGPADWTYYSTHHFFESTFGNWTVYVSDEGAGAAGNVQQISLLLEGVTIADSDHDGLDDAWETNRFGNLAQGPAGDPDQDGYSNLREYLMGTNPNAVDTPFKLDLSIWNSRNARLSWPGRPGFTYEISAGTNVTSLSVVTNLPSRFPETDWFPIRNGTSQQYFRVRAIAPP